MGKDAGAGLSSLEGARESDRSSGWNELGWEWGKTAESEILWLSEEQERELTGSCWAAPQAWLSLGLSLGAASWGSVWGKGRLGCARAQGFRGGGSL